MRQLLETSEDSYNFKKPSAVSRTSSACAAQPDSRLRLPCPMFEHPQLSASVWSSGWQWAGVSLAGCALGTGPLAVARDEVS